MNRTIKFRAWDKEKKEMLKSNDDGTCKVSPEVYDSAFIFIGLNGEVMKYERERTRGATFFDAGIQGQHDIDGTNGNFILMQFTGLKDKNGKKVFQGDILKVQSAKEDYGECSYGGFLKVVAETCGYRLEPFNPTLKEIEDKGEFWDSSSLWHITESKYIEVIGNVFENKELIK